METRDEIRDFLTTRRARVTPEEAGLPNFGGSRRVAGLRREEVAMLAGVSIDYYIRLERGDARGASEDVLDGLARALKLDEAERAHLTNLFHRSNTDPIVRDERVRPEVKRIVDAMAGVPAMVRNRRLDILYANRLGRGLYSEMYRDPVRPPNPARFVFFDPRASQFFVDWHAAAEDMAALLRAESGRSPGDGALADLVKELSTRSDTFRDLWAHHDVLFHRTGAALFRHPIAGDLTLIYEDLDIGADLGQTILVFTAEPGSESEERLRVLADWAARHGPAESEDATRTEADRPSSPGHAE